MDIMQREIAILKKGLAELKLNQVDSVIPKFREYLEVLYEYKNRIHLISHRDYTRISLKHFLPSLVVLPLLGHIQRACDIGAGAGFPSVPIKILRPEIEFTLFESVKKKASFLQYLIERLGLTKIQVVNMRAEDYKDENFELILIRAAGALKKLVPTVYQLLKPNGKAIFYKSPNINKELEGAKQVIEKYRFVLDVKETLTPVSHEALALVSLQKQSG